LPAGCCPSASQLFVKLPVAREGAQMERCGCSPVAPPTPVLLTCWYAQGSPASAGSCVHAMKVLCHLWHGCCWRVSTAGSTVLCTCVGLWRGSDRQAAVKAFGSLAKGLNGTVPPHRERALDVSGAVGCACRAVANAQDNGGVCQAAVHPLLSRIGWHYGVSSSDVSGPGSTAGWLCVKPQYCLPAGQFVCARTYMYQCAHNLRRFDVAVISERVSPTKGSPSPSGCRDS
jgi:hypothetical protein